MNITSKETFINLMQNVEKKLYIIAKSKLDNEEDVKDIIQETILLGYKNINQLKSADKFDAWIISILLNNCNKFYKSKKNINHVSYEENEFTEHDNNQYEKIENKIDFYSLLELLDDEDEKDIFILFYSDDYTTKQISKLLKINENTVKTKLRRARNKVQNYIERWESYGR